MEGMDLLFMNRSRVPAVPDQVSCLLLFLMQKQERRFKFELVTYNYLYILQCINNNTVTVSLSVL